MQTFLPLPDFAASAACLDWQRLSKQRSEVLQLLKAVNNPGDRLHKHPACIMWWGFSDALVDYGLAICDEWISRGYDDDTRRKILAFRSTDLKSIPKWIGEANFHASHRGNLLRKDFSWYSKFGWTDSPLLPYVWPRNCDPRLFIS